MYMHNISPDGGERHIYSNLAKQLPAKCVRAQRTGRPAPLGMYVALCMWLRNERIDFQLLLAGGLLFFIDIGGPTTVGAQT